MISVDKFKTKEEFMSALQKELACTQNNASKKLPKALAQHYLGQPIASSLVGLKTPRIRIKIGQLVDWEMPLPVSYIRPADQTYLEALLNESPSDLGLPPAAFKHSRPNILKPDHLPPERLLARVHIAKLYTLPGGLLRTDLPAVASRSEERPPSIELYHPLNPFAAS
jgi:hypothetical protein